MLTFLKTNWFAVGAVIFSSAAFVATTQAMSAEVGRLSDAAPLVDARVTALEENSKQQTSVLTELRDTMKDIRGEAEKQGRSVAALCERTGARCVGG